MKPGNSFNVNVTDSRIWSSTGEPISSPEHQPELSLKVLSLLHAATSPPTVAALAALDARLGAELPLDLVELALIHPSFWATLDSLPSAASAPSLRTTPNGAYTHSHDHERAHNAALDTLGNAVLGTLCTELLVARFPHLPLKTIEAATTLYVGPKSLARVAHGWGIAPGKGELELVGSEALDAPRQSKHERAYGHLVEGVGPGRNKHAAAGASGPVSSGLLRWDRRRTSPAHDRAVLEDALASAARAMTGAIAESHGFAAARDFAHRHFLARLAPGAARAQAVADLAPLFKFGNPSHVLTSMLRRHSMPETVHRVLRESGRLSNRAMFLVGAFSGDKKLGEGFGSSLKMAAFRASEDALVRAFLAGPTNETWLKAGLPSDAWADPENEFAGLVPGASEIEEESRARAPRTSL